MVRDHKSSQEASHKYINYKIKEDLLSSEGEEGRERGISGQSMNLLKSTISRMKNYQNSRLTRIEELPQSNLEIIKSKFSDSLDSEEDEDEISQEYQAEIKKVKEKLLKKLQHQYSNNLINISTEESLRSRSTEGMVMVGF